MRYFVHNDELKLLIIDRLKNIATHTLAYNYGPLLGKDVHLYTDFDVYMVQAGLGRISIIYYLNMNIALFQISESIVFSN